MRALGCLCLIGALIIGAPATAQRRALAPALRLPAPDARPALTIGVLDGPDAYVFGRIAGVAVDDSGNVFVLDPLALEVRWFDAHGRFRGRAGGEGGGPGELKAPVGLAVDGAGGIYVLDPANARISTYAPADSGLARVRDLRVMPQATALCALGQRLYVLGLVDEGLVHELDEDGRVLRSFGEPMPVDEDVAREFPGDVAMLSWQANLGSLACDAATGTVIVLHERSGLVRAFSADGRRLWRTRLPDFHPVRWVRSKRGGRWLGMSPDPETGVASDGEALALTPAGRVVVTVGENSRADLEVRLRAVVLRLRDGAVLRQAPVPARLAAIGRGHAYGWAAEPYPRVVVY